MPELELPVHELFRDSYVRYALEVIRDRALVSCLDGLKPVQRRILWGMKEENLRSSGPTRKVAKIVGRVMGDYHPHGDKSISDALVHLAQPWTMRVPLIVPQGNFGSPDKDPPAAQRYIEAKLSPAGEMMLEDCIEEICEFGPNYDQTLMEPTYLASKFPHILINGHDGISVGFKSTAPCHNPNEACDAIKLFIDKPDATVEDLLKVMPGPDWPTGGIVFSDGIREYYETGCANLVVQGKFEIDCTGSKPTITVTQLPYQIGATKQREKLVALLQSENNGILSSSIESVSNFSDKDRGLVIVIELKSGSNPKMILEELLKSKSLDLRTYFNVHQVALFDRRPEQASVLTLIRTYILHRQTMVTRRCKYELEKAYARQEILSAYISALSNIQKVIKTIEQSSSRQEAISNVSELLKLNVRQSTAIVELQLQRLTGLEKQKIQEEYDALSITIADLIDILNKPSRIDDIIKMELDEVKSKCGSPRMTLVAKGAPQEIESEDLVESLDVCVMINHDNTLKIVKRFEDDLTANEKDRIARVIKCKNTDYLMAFTKDGRYLSSKIHLFDINTRKAIGGELFLCDSPIISYAVVQDIPDHYISILTKNGKLKKSPVSDFPLITRKPLPSINLSEGDEVVDVLIHNNDGDYMILTNNNHVVRYGISSVNDKGRNTAGVNAISKTAGQPIRLMLIMDDNDYLVVVTNDGYGKKTILSEFSARNTNGAKGVTIMNHPKSRVIGACIGNDRTQISMFGNTGSAVWYNVSDLRKYPRGARGDILVQLIMGQELLKLERIM